MIDPTFLFRFSVPCYYASSPRGNGQFELGPEYRLPSLSELDGRPQFADFRLGWNEDGLVIRLCVKGKSQSPWCRQNRMEDSDGLQVWLDTRAGVNVHRAGRYSHRFGFLPCGGGQGFQMPVADQMLIHRARENAEPVRPGQLKLHRSLEPDGYILSCRLPAAALTGYDPAQYERIGFTYAVVDRELGWQTMTVGPELPFTEDPSLWATLELVREK